MPHSLWYYNKVNIGLSPSGKATDFDSVISLVRIQPAQPRRSELRCVQNARLIAGHFSFASLLLLFRKRSRSAYLLGCKRPRDGSLSLPTFCGLTAAIIESERAFCLGKELQRLDSDQEWERTRATREGSDRQTVRWTVSTFLQGSEATALKSSQLKKRTAI